MGPSLCSKTQSLRLPSRARVKNLSTLVENRRIMSSSSGEGYTPTCLKLCVPIEYEGCPGLIIWTRPVFDEARIMGSLFGGNCMTIIDLIGWEGPCVKADWCTDSSGTTCVKPWLRSLI